VSIRLEGVVSNRNGIGAQVDVWLSGQRISRNVLPSGGFHDFSDLQVIAGLNGAYSLDSIIVYWPSGIVQKLGQTNGDEFLTIVEDEETYIGQVNRRNDEIQVSISPNPVTENATINIRSANNEQVNITLMNVRGQEIKKIFNGTAQQKEWHISFHVSDLSKGIYFLKAESGKKVITKKLIIL
jgi:hypothetical protein